MSLPSQRGANAAIRNIICFSFRATLTNTPAKGHYSKTQCYLILFEIISALTLHFSTLPFDNGRAIVVLNKQTKL